MRATFESWLHRQWTKRGLLAWALSPLSLVFLCAARNRRNKTKPHRLPVPVVVVGNIYVGGTGKTPVTIALVKELLKRGYHPGVVSRGFGRKEDAPLMVLRDSPAANVGDEPLLIARQTEVPVAVARDRVAAALLLLDKHPECDLIISDDGLQHYSLARDVELAVVGARGLGNGWVLPAGPLREPPSRLDEVDAIHIGQVDIKHHEVKEGLLQLQLCAAAIGGKPYRGELRWIGQAEKLLKRKTLYRVILNDQDSHPVPPLGT